MDWLTFISKIMESLAWPIAVIIMVIILRLPLAQLVSLLRKLKYKGLELDFAEKLEKVETEAERADLPRPVSIHPEKMIAGINADSRISIRQLAITSPRAAIGEIWRQLESAISDALERKGIALPTQPRRLQTLLQLAQKKEILPPQIIPLIVDLRGLRNQAVHEREFNLDVDQALEYIDLSERVILSLQS